MKIAVVGCGAISDIYLHNMTTRFPGLEVSACCATSLQSSGRKAEKYHIRSCTLEQILADKSVELLVNLTPPQAHAQIIRRALLAGKHVYTEKVLATSFPEAQSLAALADERGLYLGSAPDTFLGEALQSARRALDQGRIGRVTSCCISLNRRMEHFYEFLAFTRQPGGGMGYDIGPYYMSGVLSLLGSVTDVCGMIDTSRPQRVNHRPDSPAFGESYTVENENLLAATLRFAGGALGTVQLNGDSIFPEAPFFALYGTEGIMYLPNPDEFGGAVRILKPSPCGSGIVEYEEVAGTGLFRDNSRGLGVAEMADAIEHGRPNRASKEMAVHTLELLDGIVSSARSGKTVRLSTGFERPRPLERREAWMGEA